MEKALDLPQASTFCGACSSVCPVKIPLPDLLRKLRERQVERGLRPWYEMLALRVWGWTAQHPRLYALVAAIGVRCLRTLRNSDGMIGSIPFASGWTKTRFMPAPSSGRTFRALYGRERSAEHCLLGQT